MLFQIQNRRPHFMFVKLSVNPADTIVVGEGRCEIEFFYLISVLVFN